MNKLLTTFTIFIAVATITSCHTIHLRNGNNANTKYEYENFHHIGIFSLVEFSDPVVPQRICRGSWDSVRTRTGPLQILVRLVPYVSSFYSPEEVAIACSTK
ncbi:MAG: hypothetical protein N2Z70_00665 [Bdellovibrionaceae bacterium]|nr:hypothetical protein [Pseudobdellovibrionaceae bacterium]